MSVKRYIATGTGMVVMRDGNCITYADYLKLEAERDALKAVNAELVEAITVFVESHTAQINLPYECEHAERIVNKALEVME